MDWKTLREKQRRVDKWEREQGINVPKSKKFFGLKPWQKAGLRPDQIQYGRFETPDNIISFEKIREPGIDEIVNWVLNGADDIWMRQQGATESRIKQARQNLFLKRRRNRRY